MAANDKDTIYIDIDDEITGIIDKLKASDGKVVALVLPKRAAVFQSIVNMKLLKRAADNSSKHLVLITSEAGLLPLAGASGIHVAKTLTSKPEIPAGPEVGGDDEEEVNEDETQPEIDAKDHADTPVGELAGAAAAGAIAAPKPPSDDVETLELDDEDVPPEESEDEPKTRDFTPPKTKKDKKLHVPNFERFRLWLILGGVILLLLIIGVIFANYRLTKATINITTDATNVDADADINLSASAKAFDPSNNTIPAKLQQQQKTYTQTVPTTGQRNNGDRATGTVTMTACVKGFSSPDNVPAGTGVSANGQTYITQEDTKFSHSGSPNGNCIEYQANNATDITAQSGGASYNVPGNTSFNVSAGDNSESYSATGSASGGTDKIVQSVNQNDINSAKGKINPSADELKQSLQNQLQSDGYFAIESTYTAGTPVITQSAQVGDQANTVTVTEVITYTEFGVHKSDLETVIKNAISGQIDTSKQALLDDGLDKAVFNVDNMSADSAQISMSTKAEVGPNLDVNGIKQNAEGKRIGEIKSDLGNNPDVTSVDVKLTPFWVSTVPKDPNHITVNIAKPKSTSH